MSHPDSRWTHAVCDLCFALIKPGVTPSAMKMPLTEKCCACGESTRSGIYYRADPKEMERCPERTP